MGVNETVLKYLKDQNRPYSANDIMQNLHKEFGKTAIQKALDYLVAKEKVIEKKYGKQKVYAVVKEGTFNREEFQARVDQLKSKQAELEAQIAKDEAELKSSETKLRELKSSVTTSEAIREQSELQKVFSELHMKHELLTKNVTLISDAEKAQILKDKTRFELEWRKRKRISKDILDAILENYPKNKKILFEEIGIETDEDVGVSIPPAH